MNEKTTARLTQALGVAAGMHEERRQEVVERLDAVGGDYDLQALDAAREAAYRYVVAASELRGFRWAMRQVMEEDEIAAMAEDAGSSWEELLDSRKQPPPSSRPHDHDDQNRSGSW